MKQMIATALLSVLLLVNAPLGAEMTEADFKCHEECHRTRNTGKSACESQLRAQLPPSAWQYYVDNRVRLIGCFAAMLFPTRSTAAVCLIGVGFTGGEHYFATRSAWDNHAICLDRVYSDFSSCKQGCWRDERTRCKQKTQSSSGTDGMPCSPLILDMAGNGYALTSLTNGVTFDLGANGVGQQVSWTDRASDDAFLAYDANENGIIDDGTELFGTVTPQQAVAGVEPNGFEALKLFDAADLGGNADGIINRQDEIWDRLRLWTDSNHDGNSQAAELQYLADSDVSALDLSYSTTTQFDSHGNQLRLQSHYWTRSGAQRSLTDIFFFLNQPATLNFHPSAATDDTRVAAGASATINVMANDTDRDGNAISLFSTGVPTRGSASLALPHSVLYTPPAGYVGPDEFRYRIRDSVGLVSEGLVRVAIEGERLITYGNPTDKPIAGDWNGDGVKDVGVYRPGDASFYLSAAPGFAGAVIRFGYNNPEDVPIVGDWTGSGRDQVGLYRQTTSTFFLCDGNTAAYPGRMVTFGSPGSVPVIGHWDGTAVARLGTYKSNVFTFHSGPAPLAFGIAGDIPVAGDWDGDGLTDVGVFRPSDGKFYTRGKSGTVKAITYGLSGDRPITGDWSGAGFDGVGVVRSNVFRLNVVSQP